MDPGLSLEQAPPIDGPFRFFLTAPLFGVAAALLLLASDGLLLSRWTPGMLALTHLLTLGVLGMVMFGALLQMLPVVAGSPVARPRLVAGLLHVLWSLGTAALAFGLARSEPFALQLALPLLGAALLLLIVAAGRALLRAPRIHPTVRGMLLALAGLSVAGVLGLLLLYGHAAPGVAPARAALTDLHAVWGTLGWVLLLVVAVAFQVVPMFQMTPEYPRPLQRGLPPLLLAGLLLWSLAGPEWRLVPAVAVALTVALFALATLQLQRRRKRTTPDVTLLFWRTGMAALLLGVVLWGIAAVGPPLALHRIYPLLLGSLLLLGFGTSVVVGMLYKIVPFLVWFHLQSRKIALGPEHAARRIPNMRQVIAPARARRQFALHLLMLLLLPPALLAPQWLMPPFALAMAASFGLLALNLGAAARLYRRTAREMAPITEGGD